MQFLKHLPFSSVMHRTLKPILAEQSKLCTQKFCLDQFQVRSKVHMDMPVALFKASVIKGNIFMLEVSFMSCFLFNIFFCTENSPEIYKEVLNVFDTGANEYWCQFTYIYVCVCVYIYIYIYIRHYLLGNNVT